MRSVPLRGVLAPALFVALALPWSTGSADSPRERRSSLPRCQDSAAVRSVDVDGQTVRAVVAGEGSPAVVFVSDRGRPASDWDRVLPGAARLARVVAFDSAPSATGAAAPDPDRAAGQLERLLTAMDIAPPYVLVGHGSGALVVRRFAALHAAGTAGLVLVEPAGDIGSASVPVVDPSRGGAAAASRPAGPRPEIPTVVLSAGVAAEAAAGSPAPSAPDRVRSQGELAAGSSNAVHIVVGGSGPSIPRDAPEAVLKAVRWVLERSAAPLWGAAGLGPDDGALGT